MQKMWYAPLWPLGLISPAYRGTGAAFTFNLQAGTEESTEYMEAAAKGFIVTPRRNNGGYIYVVQKGSNGLFDSNDPEGTVIMAIPAGSGPQHLPQGEYGENRYKLSDIGIDIDVDGDGAFVCAIMQ